MSSHLHAQIIKDNWPVVLPLAVAELPPGVISLPEGKRWAIADPLQKLRDKYFDGGTALSREFDLYPARRAQDPGWGNRLEGADITATVLMNSQVESWDVDTLFGRRQQIEHALAAIPTDLDLADADLTTNHALRTDLANLFGAFKLPGIGIAKASKLLCLKRPGSIPMLDRLVRRAMYNCVEDTEPSLPDEPAAFGQAVVREMIAFRRVMLWHNEARGHPNLVVLRALAAELNRKMSESFGQTVVVVTPVRVLDNLLWMEWGGAERHFGYTTVGDRVLKK